MIKRFTLTTIALIILVACSQADTQFVSPLGVSPLITERFVTIYMPVIESSELQPMPTPTPRICERNAVAHELAQLIINHPGQQRKRMICHAILVQVAQARADDMFDRQYFGHCDPDGVCPNRHVEDAGYDLPDSYAENGNNIESIASNQKNAEDAFNALIGSPSHRVHLLGESGFFAEQECYGIGYTDKTVRSVPWKIDKAYVIITAPCP